MKIVLILCALLGLVLADDDKCGPLQRLKVKTQWRDVFGSGKNRNEFAIAMFRSLFIQAPESRALFKRVNGDDIHSGTFTAHAVRVMGGLDIAINSLDDPQLSTAIFQHLHDQHVMDMKIPQNYFHLFKKSLMKLVPAALGRCFDEDAWSACYDVILEGIIEHHPGHSQSGDTFDNQWEGFKDIHNKDYSSEEEQTRKEIFRSNLKKIDMHNHLHSKGKKSFELGINEYSDMEPREFVRVMNGLLPRDKPSTGETYVSPNIDVNLPDEVDWRDKGYVTPVKNQGHCGSCWSFSTTGSLEGQHFHKTGKLVSLSEQNLIDCSTSYDNHGCNGGLMDYAFQYIKDNQGVDTEISYPYEAKEGVCRFESQDVGATVAGYKDVPHGDEDSLKEVLATIGPISIAIDASQQSFQFFKTGVYDEPICSSQQLDHGVLLVGYGTEEGQDYWLVKNSWGPTWGEEGYIKMARNKDNQCGIATQASYPLV